MNEQNTRERIGAGDTVVSADGEELGTVAALHDAYLLVEKGVLFLTDYHIPYSAVEHYDADEGIVHLNISADDALNSGWDRHPEDPEDGPVDTLLSGAATVPDPPDLAVVEPGDDPLRSRDASD